MVLISGAGNPIPRSAEHYRWPCGPHYWKKKKIRFIIWVIFIQKILILQPCTMCSAHGPLKSAGIKISNVSLPTEMTRTLCRTGLDLNLGKCITCGQFDNCDLSGKDVQRIIKVIVSSPAAPFLIKLKETVSVFKFHYIQLVFNWEKDYIYRERNFPIWLHLLCLGCEHPRASKSIQEHLIASKNIKEHIKHKITSRSGPNAELLMW